MEKKGGIVGRREQICPVPAQHEVARGMQAQVPGVLAALKFPLEQPDAPGRGAEGDVEQGVRAEEARGRVAVEVAADAVGVGHEEVFDRREPVEHAQHGPDADLLARKGPLRDAAAAVARREGDLEDAGQRAIVVEELAVAPQAGGAAVEHGRLGHVVAVSKPVPILGALVGQSCSPR